MGTGSYGTAKYIQRRQKRAVLSQCLNGYEPVGDNFGACEAFTSSTAWTLFSGSIAAQGLHSHDGSYWFESVMQHTALHVCVQELDGTSRPA